MGNGRKITGKPFWKKASAVPPMRQFMDFHGEESRAWTPCSAKGGWHPEIKEPQTAAASSARYRRKSHIIHLFN